MDGPTIIYSQLAVVPMGWTHAHAICQQAHEHVVNLCNLKPSKRIKDFSVVEPLSASDPEPLHLQYVDNFASIGVCEGSVNDALERVKGLLELLGLPVHEVEAASTQADLLGWELNGSRSQIRPTKRQAWKIKLAVSQLLVERRASSKTIERLVGHRCFVALLRRETL